MSRPHEHKLAIVTGGSRGIGEAVAQALAHKGANLVIVYSSNGSRAKTEQLCAHLSSAHDIHCLPVQADLGDAAPASEKILSAAKEFFASYNSSDPFRVDIVVNNAGVSSNQFLNDTSEGPITTEEFTRVYAVNVLGPLLLIQALAPFLPEDRSGRIVNVSSVSSSIGYEGQSVYAGSKAAIEAMTRTWSRELASRATVNAINPGPIWGDMYAKAGERFWKINQPHVECAPLSEYHGEQVVLDKLGSDAARYDRLVTEGWGGRRPAFTSEVAGTIVMLCSDEAGWTTGSVVCANGGMKMSIA